MLKLYPEGDAPPAHVAAKPVVSERYDEFVFNNPSEGLRKRLTADVVPSAKGWRNSQHAKYYTDDFEADAPQLQNVYQAVTAELQSASKRRRVLEDELKLLGGDAPA
jgi:hypothetical protein